jgi:phosphatidylglycerol:prolipoprotein diacylglycerol transferase
MFPELFSIGPITIYTYGVLLAASYLLGLQFARARARKWGLDPNRVLDLGIYIIIAALVGAKLLLLVTDFNQFRASATDLLSFARSAGVFYGGLIAAIGVAFWYIHRHQMPFWTTCDAFAPAIALGHVTGRLGCFAAGCCYGKPTSVPWAVVFTNPTQLYESGTELLILIVLLATERRGRPFPGRTFWLYMILYAVSRYIIEFYRGDPRGVIFGVSTSQFISLLLLPLAIAMLIWLRRSTPETPQRMPRRRKVAA